MAESDPVRIIPHEPIGIPDCGSFEVRFADGRESRYFYYDNNPGRRSITGRPDQETAKKQAQEFARKEAK
jgi:hypothetical protein